MKHSRYFTLFFISIFLGIIIKYSFLMVSYSGMFNTFEGGPAFYLQYIKTNGHLLSRTIALNEKHSVFGAGIDLYNSYPLLGILYATLSMILDIPFDGWAFRILLGFFFSLLLMSSASLFLLGFNKLEKYDSFSLLVCFLYILQITPGVISQRGADGWMMMFFLFYLYFCKNYNNKTNIFLLCIYFMFFPSIYLTASSIYLLFLFIFSVFVMVTNTEYFERVLLFLILYMLFWFSHGLFLGTSRYLVIINLVKSLVNLFVNGVNISNKFIIPSNYLVATSLLNKIKYVLNAFFVVLPPILFVKWRYLIRPKNKYLYDGLFVYLLFTLPLIGLLSWVWFGYFGIPRLAEYGALASIMVFVSTIFNVDKDKKKLLVLIGICTILTSNYSSITNENTPVLWLTYEEEGAITFCVTYLSRDEVIFSDHRIGGGLIGQGHVKTIGVSLQDVSDDDILHVINDLFSTKVSSNPKKIIEGIRSMKNEIADVVLYSTQLTKNIPGITLYELPIRPPSADFLSKYDSISFNFVFNNGEAFLYEL